ncbi:MAG: hypothetical protein MO852_06785 [Candidatus Devosia euplotis]|nr:hypothetical protein [Candidatus Devosia euplotis]
MITHIPRLAVLALPALLGIGIAATAGTAGMASATADTIQCGVVERSERGMLALEGAILSPQALSGEYHFALRSIDNGGSSNISQGGSFTVPANVVTPVGKVMINNGARYTLDFTVTVDGQTIDRS